MIIPGFFGFPCFYKYKGGVKAPFTKTNKMIKGMKHFLNNINKSEMASVIALIIILMVFTVSLVSLTIKTVDKDLSILIIGQCYGLAAFVAGYYFNKKQTTTTTDIQKPEEPC